MGTLRNTSAAKEAAQVINPLGGGERAGTVDVGGMMAHIARRKVEAGLPESFEEAEVSRASQLLLLAAQRALHIVFKFSSVQFKWLTPFVCICFRSLQAEIDSHIFDLTKPESEENEEEVGADGLGFERTSRSFSYNPEDSKMSAESSSLQVSQEGLGQALMMDGENIDSVDTLQRQVQQQSQVSVAEEEKKSEEIEKRIGFKLKKEIGPKPWFTSGGKSKFLVSSASMSALNGSYYGGSRSLTSAQRGVNSVRVTLDDGYAGEEGSVQVRATRMDC